ncbi:hypothetical protein RN001_011718 [Aquatica leii]|uniref:Uncharacterized protein n=1 Tax=Aquatica leii TaxID=1421715 RepID=A0AAN7S7I4_9COLE|nr:hypothetical protein RN001_011718 [Aquatica leii]
MELQMTFRDLENLIESNIGDVQEQEIAFKNKADGLQQHYFASTTNNDKLSLIQDRTNVLGCVNEQIEREIKKVNAFISEMENRINHLENRTRSCCNKNDVSNRTKLYGLTDHINAYIHNCKEEVELVKTSSLQFAKTHCQDTPLEGLGRMMMTLLEALEEIELNLEKMKSHMHCINWKNKILEEKLYNKRSTP